MSTPAVDNTEVKDVSLVAKQEISKPEIKEEDKKAQDAAQAVIAKQAKEKAEEKKALPPVTVATVEKKEEVKVEEKQTSAPEKKEELKVEEKSVAAPAEKKEVVNTPVAEKVATVATQKGVQTPAAKDNRIVLHVHSNGHKENHGGKSFSLKDSSGKHYLNRDSKGHWFHTDGKGNKTTVHNFDAKYRIVDAHHTQLANAKKV
jgi:outer membrane biosynthesis protein TonB